MANINGRDTLQDDLLKDVSTLKARADELFRQHEALGDKIDHHGEELCALLEKRFDFLSEMASRLGERIGIVERDIDTLRTRCSSESSHRDCRLADLAKSGTAYSDRLNKLWELENQRKGRAAVLAAIGGFIGTLCGGIIFAMAKLVFGL